MYRTNLYALALFLLVLTASNPSLAQYFGWDGHLDVVLTDAGTGRYSGVLPGHIVNGYFGIPTCAAGCQVEPISPNETHYRFDSFTSAAIKAPRACPCSVDRTLRTKLEVANDKAADQTMADQATALGFTLSLGQSLDMLSMTGEMGSEGTDDFLDWKIRLMYATTNPLVDTSPVQIPGTPDLVIIEIDEGSGTIYSAIGTGYVPEPGFASLLVVGCCGLALGSRRARTCLARKRPRLALDRRSHEELRVLA